MNFGRYILLFLYTPQQALTTTSPGNINAEIAWTTVLCRKSFQKRMKPQDDGDGISEGIPARLHAHVAKLICGIHKYVK